MFCAVLSLQLCPTLCDLMDCSSLGSSLHGILQVRILEWVAISFYRGSSQTRDRFCISWIGRPILYQLASWEAIQIETIVKCSKTKKAMILSINRQNPMEGGAWRATVHGVAKSRTRPSDFTFTFHWLLIEFT